MTAQRHDEGSGPGLRTPGGRCFTQLTSTRPSSCTSSAIKSTSAPSNSRSSRRRASVVALIAASPWCSMINLDELVKPTSRMFSFRGARRVVQTHIPSRVDLETRSSRSACVASPTTEAPRDGRPSTTQAHRWRRRVFRTTRTQVLAVAATLALAGRGHGAVSPVKAARTAAASSPPHGMALRGKAAV